MEVLTGTGETGWNIENVHILVTRSMDVQSSLSETFVIGFSIIPRFPIDIVNFTNWHISYLTRPNIIQTIN